ncbi:16S rRNA (guanine(527)-N(7))-methyltransferase RsmG [Virgibacillus sp. 179-BFC.A HS]|uniref:Ribosomal RNA small subunit methyltransferase G n=1 Tax=Tigheibacillus jepli TaxID=3035914 RepID=A0ABU5CF29_9BACI|nr:16S rRNA (guanine(527)-N(7))-methyltransferase RsmG [Virgibacillus sp. 179-BFC.A HS]MDY0404125.1 16S rRNA (guanine(527)-N(7))-methyltransferase RsmG [Virgibacillus sp. 179-BFC.A HS]
MNPTEFAAELRKKGIDLDEKQLEQFAVYYKTLVAWNEKMNLTAITDEKDVYLKHFYDSVTAAFYYDFSKPLQVCDVGAGAGFPSIPLKICFPDLQVTIVDSLKKRIGFLNHLAAELQLTGVAFYHDRAENIGKNADFREKFDIVTARAVARMSVLSELCLPLCKKGGMFIAMKGAKAEDELKEAQAAIEVCGGQVQAVHDFQMPLEQSERSIMMIEKKRNTPKKYPRKAGTPGKDPIM